MHGVHKQAMLKCKCQACTGEFVMHALIAWREALTVDVEHMTCNEASNGHSVPL